MSKSNETRTYKIVYLLMNSLWVAPIIVIGIVVGGVAFFVSSTKQISEAIVKLKAEEKRKNGVCP